MRLIFKKENGITLIALVITVIILLILAGVALSLITGQNGLFARANQAGYDYDKSAQAEVGKVNELNDFLDLYGNQNGNQNLPLSEEEQKALEQYGGLAQASEIHQDYFKYNILSESTDDENGIVELLGINWEYFFPEIEYDEYGFLTTSLSELDMDSVAVQLQKIVIPYEVTLEGKKYDIESMYTPSFPWGWHDLTRIYYTAYSETRFAAGSNIYATAGSVVDGEPYTGGPISKFSYLIIPASIKKISKPLWFSDDYDNFDGWDPISRDYILIAPNSQMREIDESAFDLCNCIEEFVVPNHVTYIGNRAFANCSMLKKIYIPKSVTSIGKEAFVHDESYGTHFYEGFWNDKLMGVVIYYEGTEEEWNKISIDDEAFGVKMQSGVLDTSFDHHTVLFNKTPADMNN